MRRRDRARVSPPPGPLRVCVRKHDDTHRAAAENNKTHVSPARYLQSLLPGHPDAPPPPKGGADGRRGSGGGGGGGGARGIPGGSASADNDDDTVHTAHCNSSNLPKVSSVPVNQLGAADSSASAYNDPYLSISSASAYNDDDMFHTSAPARWPHTPPRLDSRCARPCDDARGSLSLGHARHTTSQKMPRRLARLPRRPVLARRERPPPHSRFAPRMTAGVAACLTLYRSP